MAPFVNYKILAMYGMMVVIMSSMSESVGGQARSCPEGWTTYQLEGSHSCLLVSESKVASILQAQVKCLEKNASLIIIDTKTKLEFFEDLISRPPRHDKDNSEVSEFTAKVTWIGLQKIGPTVTWLTSNGPVPAKNLPYGLSIDWSQNLEDNKKGLIYAYGHLVRPTTFYVDENAYYVCETSSVCKKGLFGKDCDKECHCYRQECDLSRSGGIDCAYGCQVGWMGPGCHQRKDDAHLHYFCVNSTVLGTFVYIRIATKGVSYQRITATNEEGMWIPWCKNSTAMHTDTRSGAIVIKIYANEDDRREIKAGRCPGKITRNGDYEWVLRIQEIVGLVSSHDQEVHLSCDFLRADTFDLFGNIDVRQDKWFRRSGNRKPIEYLEGKRESLDMEIVDPYTGNRLSRGLLGRPVVLKITYSFLEGDEVATGIKPFNCSVRPPNYGGGQVQYVMLLDEHGCPLKGSPISGFHRNTSQTLVTEPFPLFGFDGHRDVRFNCLYSLCFGSYDCDHDDSRCPSNQEPSTVAASNGDNTQHGRVVNRSIVDNFSPVFSGQNANQSEGSGGTVSPSRSRRGLPDTKRTVKSHGVQLLTRTKRN